MYNVCYMLTYAWVITHRDFSILVPVLGLETTSLMIVKEEYWMVDFNFFFLKFQIFFPWIMIF